MNNCLRLLSAAFLALMLVMQPIAAVAESAAETAERLLQKLLEVSFKADMSAEIVGKEGDSLAGRLYRRPPDRFRLEYYEEGEIVGYYLEDAVKSVRVFPRERRAIVMRGRRLSPVFGLIAGCLARVPRDEGLTVTSDNRDGRKVYVLKAQSGQAAFSAVFDAEDELIREFTASRQVGDPGIKLALSNVETVAAKAFPPGFFDIPPGFEVIGLGARIGEGQREQLRIFQKRLPKARHRALESKGVAEDAETAEGDYFLPALPMKLPQGFVIESVTPLFFSERLLYHIELVNSEDVQLVSVFETKHEEYRDEFRGIRRGNEKYYLDLPFGDTGIYVILISEDVKEEKLREIFESLEFQPEMALRLIDEALGSILAE